MSQILEGDPITLGELKAYINAIPSSRDKWPIYIFEQSNPLTGFLLKAHREMAPIYTMGYPDVTRKPHKYIILNITTNVVCKFEQLKNDKPE